MDGRNKQQRVLFVSGIDTGIGKTYATAMLSNRYAEQGYRVCTQKIVQTGCVGASEDIATHRRLSHHKPKSKDEPNLTCPYIFTYPASPHLAAEIDGQTIDPDRISQATQALLSSGYEYIILEGAGGLMVPLTRSLLTIDYISQEGLPVALVTSGRLGSINHTLLSLEACHTRDIEVAYVIYNRFPPTDKLIEDDTFRYITEYLKTRRLTSEIIELPIMHEEIECIRR